MKGPTITAGTVSTEKVTMITDRFDRTYFFNRMFERLRSHPNLNVETNALITLEVSYGAVGLTSPLARGLLGM